MSIQTVVLNSTFPGGQPLVLEVAGRVPADKLARTAIEQAVANGVSLAYRDMRGLNLTAAHIDKIDATGACLDAAQLTGASVVGGCFDHVSMQRAAFDGIDATDASFVQVNATGALFNKMKAKGSNWTSANIRHAVYNGADLEDAVFTKTYAHFASFKDAVFLGVRIDGAQVHMGQFLECATPLVDIERFALYGTKSVAVEVGA